MKVLLVDDEKEFVSALAERLSFRGIDADWTVSGEDALKMAQGKQYEVAVLDVKMPLLGGIELGKKLHGLHSQMKFIFVTGHGSLEDFKVGSTVASFYLAKPLKIEELIQKIKEAMNR
ncbi:MAG TPA: response regulator [Syntrophobacteria bacterium]|nr:response regulator [Syntrophobacteria bacterium]